jgi:hypothetical protein
LKPDCIPSSTEVDSVQRHRTLENARCNLVRMIKPNLIFSHDWHVQPNCQRSLRVIRLSGTLLDRGLKPLTRSKVSSNLLRLPEYVHLCRLRRFCANLLKLSKFVLHVKLNLPISREESNLNFRQFAQRKISNNDQQSMPEPLRLTGDNYSWVLQWYVLSRDSLQGFRGTCRA